MFFVGMICGAIGLMISAMVYNEYQEKNKHK